MLLPTFVDFVSGPGGQIAAGLGVPVSKCTSWQAFTAACCETDGFSDAAKHYAETCSGGERVVLAAILYAADYAGLADTLSKGTWRALSFTGGDYKAAAIAALARVNA